MFRTILMVTAIMMLAGCKTNERKARKYYQYESGYAHVNVTQGSVEVTVPQSCVKDVQVKANG